MVPITVSYTLKILISHFTRMAIIILSKGKSHVYGTHCQTFALSLALLDFSKTASGSVGCNNIDLLKACDHVVLPWDKARVDIILTSRLHVK